MSNCYFKVYTTNYEKLKYIAKTFNLKLIYLKGVSSGGYVSDGEFLKFFSEYSYVDENVNIKELVEFRRRL